jgi:DMSO/TMAO reductase YedYZ molybdopterin-dependent catalytic subunit
MGKDQTSASGRRDFLKLAGLGAAAGSVAVAAKVAPAVADEAAASASKPGYRETDHVRKVYEVARF